jgi:hypothetical protein
MVLFRSGGHRKFSRKSLLRSAVIAAAVACISWACLPFASPTGTLDLAIGLADIEGTILPVVNVDSYRISFEGPVSKSAVLTSQPSSTIDLDVGTWDISVEGKDGGGNTIAVGAANGVVVLGGQTAPVSIELSPLDTGSGTIDVTVTWPGTVDPVIGVCEVTLDGDAVPPGTVTFTPGGTMVRYVEEKSAGTYQLGISLESGAALRASVLCGVLVSGSLTSSATIDLNEGDFTWSPDAPGGLSVADGPSRLDLQWVDNADSETDYVVERSEADNQHFGVLVDDLPANTVGYSDTTASMGVSYYYRVKARNAVGDSGYSNEGYGSWDAVTTTFIADHTVINKVRLDQIPESAIQDAKDNLHVVYWHTSHGAQILDGMTYLPGFKEANGGAAGLYDWNVGGVGDALDVKDNAGIHLSGRYNDPAWADFLTTNRNYLDANPTCNVVVWSWCWPDPDADTVSRYLDAMATIRGEYPSVTFVYMTWHGASKEYWANVQYGLDVQYWNQYIRQYCIDNGLALFDFFDIEMHDPDGTSFLARRASDDCSYDNASPYDSGTLDGNWASEWQNAHTAGEDWYLCGSSDPEELIEHTKPVNVNQKAYAAWWLWARLGGWDGN